MVLIIPALPQTAKGDHETIHGSKLIFNLLLLWMARGRMKDDLCITGVYSPHPSFPPPTSEA